MELRWYWRVLRRQARLIILTTLIVAFLAALYTAYSYYTTEYTAAQTIEFKQQQPLYQTQTISIDPIQAAAANAGAASNDAKFYSEGDSYFKGVSAYMLKFHNKKIDYKSIPVGVTQTGPLQMRIDYKSSDSTLATWAVQGGIYVLEHQWLPVYNQKLLETTAKGFKQNVYEPQIEINPNFDALNVRTTSKLKEIQAWIVKCLVGLVLGVALAFLWEYLDESIHDEQDVRNWMHVPTLGVIPGGKTRAA